MLAGATGGAGGCSNGTDPAAALQIIVEPGAHLLTGIGQEITFRATVVGNPGATVTWAADHESVVSIDAASGRVTAVGGGVTRVRARVGESEGSAPVEVYLAPPWDLVPGASSFGRNDYVEYLVGNLPLVISAPHGGYEEPSEIPSRTFGVLGQDRMTQETAREIATAVFRDTGGWPHVIINRLHRSRLDANREIVEAAQGSPFSELAWTEYHEVIDTAKSRAVGGSGTALFIDLHGHGHEIQRLELGYLLNGDDLDRSNGALDAGTFSEQSSIRRLANSGTIPFSALLRGPESMGGMLQDVGVRSVPSPTDPSPLGAPFFAGGYNTRRHGSRDGGLVDGIQFELNWSGIRESADDRTRFAEAFAGAAERYMATHFAVFWTTPAASAMPR